MRKHFLLLFLMALLPLAGWAEGEPTAIASLKYTGRAQALVNAGTTENKHFYYALGESATTGPAASAYSATIPTGVEVATYHVWFIAKDAEAAVTAAEASAATAANNYVAAAIAKADNLNTLDVLITLNDQDNSAEYSGTAIVPQMLELRIGDQSIANWTNDYEWKLYNSNATATVASFLNAGTYKVAIKAKNANPNVTGDTECAADDRVTFTVTKAPLDLTLTAATEITYGTSLPTAIQYTVNESMLKNNESVDGIGIAFGNLENIRSDAEYHDVAHSPYTYSFVKGNYNQTLITAPNYKIKVMNSTDPQLVIKKKDLDVYFPWNNSTDAPASEAIVKTYGTTNKTATELTTAGAVLKVFGWATGEEATEVGALTLTYPTPAAPARDLAANYNVAGDAATSETTYEVGLALANENALTNYNFNYVNPALHVKQVSLTTGAAFTFAKGTTPDTDGNDFIYGGDGKSPLSTATIKYVNGDIFKTATPDVFTTFTFKYKENGATSDPVATLPVDAGTYNVYVSATGNYAATDLLVAALQFKIGKKPLKLNAIASNLTKTYDNQAFDLTSVTFQPSGLVDADLENYDGTLAGVTAQYTAALSLAGPTTYVAPTTVGDYEITPVVDADNFTFKKNYVSAGANLVKAKISIVRRNVTVSAKDQTIQIGDDAPVLANTEAFVNIQTPASAADNTGLVRAEDKAEILAAVAVSYLDPENVPTAKNPEGYQIIQVTSEAGQSANYNIVIADPQVYGKLIINGRNFTLYANANYGNVTYGQDYALTEQWGFTAGSAELSSAQLNALKQYIVFQLLDKTTNEPITLNQAKNAGLYKVTIDGTATTAAIEAASAMPAGFDGLTISTDVNGFRIAKKTLYTKTSQVEVNAGASTTDLNTLGKAQVLFTATAAAGDNTSAVVGHDVIDFALAFNTGEGGVTVDGDNLNSPANATYAKGYKVVMGTNDNYQFAGVTVEAPATGALKVINGNLLALTDDALVIDRIKIAAEKCAADNTGATLYNVKVTGRNLNLEKWNVVVLPFDITPYEFTTAIGRYAVFNTLESVNTTNNTVSFKLQLNQLKANEPFLVKPEKTKTDVAAATTVALNQFANRYIVAPANGVPQKTDVDDVKFVGTYNDFTLTLDEDWTGDVITSNTVRYIADGGAAGSEISYLSGGKFVTATKTISGTKYSRETLDVTFTRAYLDFNESALSAPMIFVEEADGSTTAISEITAEGVAVAAEGWYTSDGVKLQGVPTQKGVYINNGKKIVVK